MFICIPLSRVTHNQLWFSTVMLAIVSCWPIFADAQETYDPQLIVGGVGVTIVRPTETAQFPSGPTTTLLDSEKNMVMALRNDSDEGKNVKLEIITVDVEGTPEGQKFWEDQVDLEPRQAVSINLTWPNDGLRLGRYRLNLTSGESADLLFNVSSEHPVAEIVEPGFRPGNGLNIAARALGGRVEASSAHSDFYDAHRLNDGVNHFHALNDFTKCINCGWAAADGDSSPVITLRLGDGGASELTTIVLDTRAFDLSSSAGLPKVVRVSATDRAGSRNIATYRLRREFGRQLLALPEPLSGESISLEIVETFSGGVARLFEIEAYESATVATDNVNGNIANPGLGGALVRFTNYSDDSPAAYLFDEDDDTTWVSLDREFPQDFTLAFSDDAPARIEAVELYFSFSDRYNAESFPAEVAIAISDHPIDSFHEIGRFPTDMRTGRHRIPVGKTARFLKVRVLDNHGAVKTTMGEIRVLGRSLADILDDRSPRALTETATPLSGTGVQEIEPNDDMGTANPMPSTTLEGTVDPLGEFDYFRLPTSLLPGTTFSVIYDGSPYIRHELRLHDRSGDVLSAFDPGDLPKRKAKLSFLLTGEEEALSLSEPPASVVVVWDTSGSMRGREGDLERAVREYIRLAPESQAIRLVSFSSEVEDLTTDFTTDKDQLLSALAGQFRAEGGTRLYDAILHAMELLGGRKGNRAIVVMTDGANSPGNTWHDDMWREIVRNRYRLYTIGLGDGLEDYSIDYGSTGERILRHLAMGTAGAAFFTRESSALTEFFSNIARELAAPATYFLTPVLEPGTGKIRLRTTAEQIPKAALPAIHVIFDVSGSMAERLPDGRTRIEVGKEAMYTTLEALPEGAPFGLTVYGARIPEKSGKEEACRDVLTLMEMSPLVKAPIIDFVGQLKTNGGTTPLARSIAHVVRNFSGQNGGIVIVITDGIEECDRQPLVTIEELKSAGLETIELNVIGFDLRNQASKEMMTRIAAIGGGRFYDADDAQTLKAALREAISASYTVRDATGREVAVGKVDGAALSIPSGFFTVELGAPEGPSRIDEVEIAPDHLTVLQVKKVGDQIDVSVDPPLKSDPRRDCGEGARVHQQGKALIKRIQEKLNALGFPAGTADGAAGSRTQAAAESFRLAHGLAESTEIDMLLEQHLDCVASIGETYRP